MILSKPRYTFAIVFVDVSNEYRNGYEVASKENVEFLEKYFFDLERSIISLFQSICNGINWADVADKLNSISRIWGYLYMFYVAFCSSAPAKSMPLTKRVLVADRCNFVTTWNLRSLRRAERSGHVRGSGSA